MCVFVYPQKRLKRVFEACKKSKKTWFGYAGGVFALYTQKMYRFVGIREGNGYIYPKRRFRQ